MARVIHPVTLDRRQLQAARSWLGLSLIVLVLAGLFALAVVVGRTPPFDRLVTDPMFFKRCLVAHVNLALVCWFYAFLAGLLWLLPGRRATTGLTASSVHVSAAGVALLLLGAGLPESRPILANYVPTIDNAAFQFGQLMFAAGVVGSLLDRRVFAFPRSGSTQCWLPEAAQACLHAAAFALVLSALTFAVSWATLPAGLSLEVRSERLVWGGGHLLQVVCTLAMLASWIVLLSAALGRTVISRPAASALSLALLLPWAVGPLLALRGSGSSDYREGFTHLMQWGIAPVVGIFTILCGRALLRALRDGDIHLRDFGDLRILGFLVSAGLALLGFALGASIRGSNTTVPAHYHASVGAVTVAFMAATYTLLQRFGMPLRSRWLQRAAGWQPLLYGGGMLIFAAGFAVAGAHGMGRKVYGAEQAARSFAESVGLGLMGFGGVVGIAGGLLFLVIVGVAWRFSAIPAKERDTEPESYSWR